MKEKSVIPTAVAASRHLCERLVETARVLAATQVQGSRDLVGFNPQDMEFGRRLANIVDVEWDTNPRAVEMLARLLTGRYQRQTESLLSKEDFAAAEQLGGSDPITMEDRAITRKTVTVMDVNDGFALGWQENNEVLGEVLAFAARERPTTYGTMYVVHTGAIQPLISRLIASGFNVALPEKLRKAIDLREERRVAPLAPSPNDIPVWLADGRLIVKLPPVAEYVAIARGIPDRLYDSKAKAWSIPEEQGIRLRNLLADAGADVRSFDALPLTDGDNVLQRLGVSKRGSRFVLLLPFDADLIARVRSIPDARYDPDAKAWTIPVSELRTFDRRLREHSIPYDRRSLDAALDTLPPPPKEYRVEIPAGVYTHDPAPTAKMLEGIALLTRSLGPLREQFGEGIRGFVFADPRGTAKTMQVAIAAHCVTPPDEQIVVICRKSGKLAWKAEIESWLGADQTVGFPSQETPVPNTRWLIVTYAMIEVVYDQLRKRGIGSLIIDEGHRIARLNTKRSRLVLGYQPREGESVDGLCSFVRTGLVYDTTGSLVRNRIRDTYAAWKAVGHPLGNSWFRFGNRYCGPKKVLVGDEERTVYDGATNLEELRKAVSPVLIERSMKELLPDLPEKVRSIIPVEIDMVKYDAHMRKFQDYLNSGLAGDSARMLQYMNEERMLTAHSVLDSTIERVDELIGDGAKVIAWTSFLDIMGTIKEHFGDVAVVYHGGMSDAQRTRAVKAFNTNDKIRIFIGQVDAAGESLSLSPNGNVAEVLNDLLWVPKDIEQIEDRAYGLRLKGANLSIDWMVAAGTLVEHMAVILERKLRDISQFQGAGSQSIESALMAELVANIRGTVGEKRRRVSFSSKNDDDEPGGSRSDVVRPIRAREEAKRARAAKTGSAPVESKPPAPRRKAK